MSDTSLTFDLPAPTTTELLFGGAASTAGPNDLVFEQSAPASTHLVFGGYSQPLGVVVQINLAGALPGLSFAALVKPITRLDLVGAFDNTLSAIMEVSYFTNTQRPIAGQATDSAQVAAPIETGNTHPEKIAQGFQAGIAHRASEAVYAHAGNTPTFATAQPAGFETAGRFQDGVKTASQLFSRWQDGKPDARIDVVGKFQDGTGARTEKSARFQDGHRDRRPSRTTRWTDGDARRKGYTSRAGYGKPSQLERFSRFQEGRVPPAGQYVRPVAPPVPLPYWGPALVFQCPPLAAPNLVFGLYPCVAADTSIPALLAILPARFYMTAHSIYAQTLPDLADVPIFDATVSADSGSYCWSLSASGPASLFEQLAPVNGLPAQIKLTLDGIPWVFAVDSLSRSKAFGQSGVRVQGRSLTALIAAPYLRSATRNNAIDRTAQQLSEDALYGTGITMDWGVGEGATANGGLMDWFVPAGAWSHQGTPLDAVQAIVQSAGGYLQSHRSAATLQARHPYGQRVGDVSGAPWAWGTGAADVELALDALITESVQRKDGADINAVYVSGTSAGVLALVKRAGTAGDALAAMITDPLITHVTAARQRGLSVLGEAGHKYAVSLDLPVLTGAGQPGVLDVGQLVQVNAAQPWRARVRSVSVQAKQPTLRQSVTLERHMETA